MSGKKKEKKPITITLFHADWCGHCKNFMETWESMKNDEHARKKIEFKDYESEELGNLDDETNRINGSLIDSFPTIKISILQKEYDYVGERTDRDIYSFIINKIKENRKIMKGGCGCENETNEAVIVKKSNKKKKK
jgi:thiol-disulfide isomerase/thioredoxin